MKKKPKSNRKAAKPIAPSLSEYNELKSEIEMLHAVQSGILGLLAVKSGNPDEFTATLIQHVEIHLTPLPGDTDKDKLLRRVATHVEGSIWSAKHGTS